MFRKGRDASPSRPDESLYERVLGERFLSLHPRLRVYFGSIPEGFEGVGEGIYEEAGLRARWLRLLFALLGRWQVAFPEHGERIPFTIRNTADESGALRAVRTFAFPTATRAMTDVMRVADGHLVDRVGSRGQVEVELALKVADSALIMESRRIALRVAGVRMPLPPLVKLVIRERAAAGEPGTQHVDVRMTAPLIGEIYGYRGSFTYSLRSVVEIRPR